MCDNSNYSYKTKVNFLFVNTPEKITYGQRIYKEITTVCVNNNQIEYVFTFLVVIKFITYYKSF